MDAYGSRMREADSSKARPTVKLDAVVLGTGMQDPELELEAEVLDGLDCGSEKAHICGFEGLEVTSTCSVSCDAFSWSLRILAKHGLHA